MKLEGKKFGKLTCICPSIKKRYWICKCDCGNEKEIRDNHLTMGKIVTCQECSIFELPGKKINSLTVIEYIGGTGGKGKSRKFLCICDCGNETIVNSTSLTARDIKTCGMCIDRHSLVDKKFGYLRVLNYSHSKRYRNSLNTFWNCICDCGITKLVDRCNLVTGHIQSCGCKRYIEGSMQGERGNVNILKESDVIEIRKQWAEELVERKATGESKIKWTHQLLADKYCVSTTCIHAVLHSRTWFFLPPVTSYLDEIKFQKRYR